jgi:H+/Cl- antiporter ClcA
MPDPIDDASRDARKENIFEVLDELIFHMNTMRNTFTLLIISSFILAPAALIMAAIFLGHPRFLQVLLNRMPDVALMLVIYTGISIILASIWLFIGIREQRFFSKWNRKFMRFMSLKNQIDRELEEDEGSHGKE